jgi:hypothetical protein
MQASDDCGRVAPNVDDRLMNGSERQRVTVPIAAALRRLVLWNKGALR